MVLPYDTWEAQAETVLRRAAADAETTTGDTMGGLVTVRPFDLSILD